jgi:hypothetical protein
MDKTLRALLLDKLDADYLADNPLEIASQAGSGKNER